MCAKLQDGDLSRQGVVGGVQVCVSNASFAPWIESIPELVPAARRPGPRRLLHYLHPTV